MPHRRRGLSLIALALLVLSSLPLGLDPASVSAAGESFGYTAVPHERVFSRNYSTNATSVSFDGANYVYGTPFGSYTWLQPGNILSFANHYGESVVEKSVYVLQYQSGTIWLPLIDFISPLVTVHNSTVYQYQYDVNYKNRGKNYNVGHISITWRTDGGSAPPKATVELTQSDQWSTSGLGSFRWIWVVTPSAAYQYYIDDEASTNVNATYPQFTSYNTAVSVGAKSKLHIGKGSVKSGDGMWLCVDTSDYGAVEREVGSEPFWNGKGTVSIFPIGSAVIDPDVAYTEMIDSFTVADAAAWTNNYDIYTNKGVPKGAVVEIALCNADANSEFSMGVRADGSTLLRQLAIHEAESGGESVATIPVKVDSTTGIIECYTGSVTNSFRILGYFSNCDFTEAYASLTISTTNWEDETLSQANRVYAIVAQNFGSDAAYTVGVRTNGSSLERKFLLHEPESGGYSQMLFYTKTDASGIIELYGSNTINCIFYNFGYFDSTVDFVEGWTQLSPGASAVWTSVSVSDVDQAGRIASIILTHSNAGAEQTIGVRTFLSSLVRSITVHESEGAGTEYNGYTASVVTGTGKAVAMYVTDNAYAYFWYSGYFKPAVTGTDYPRSASITATLSKSGGRLVAASRSPSEAIDFSGAGTRLAVLARAAAISGTITSAAGRVVGVIRATSQSIVLTSAATRLAEFARASSVALTLASAATRLAAFTRAATESLILSSASARVIGFIRGATEALTFTSTGSRLAELARTAAQSLTLTNAATRFAELVRGATQSVAFSSTADRVLGIIRGVTASLTLTTAGSRFLEAARGLTQSITLSGLGTRFAELTRGATQGFVLTSAASRIVGFIRSAAQGITLSSEAERLLGLARGATQGIALTSAASRLLDALRGVTQSFTLSSAAEALAEGIENFIRGAGITITTTLNAGRLAEFLRGAAQGLTLSTAAGRFAELVRAAAQGFSLTSAGTHIIGFVRAATQGITLTSAATRFAELVRAAAISTTFGSTATRIYEAIRGVTQSIAFTSLGTAIADAIHHFVRAAGQAIAFASDAERQIGIIRAANQTITFLSTGLGHLVVNFVANVGVVIDFFGMGTNLAFGDGAVFDSSLFLLGAVAGVAVLVLLAYLRRD